jgi:hypothetical protein
LPREFFIGREGESHSDTESFATDENGSNTDKEINRPLLSVKICVRSVAVLNGYPPIATITLSWVGDIGILLEASVLN